MSAAARLAAFSAVLAAVFTVAALAGAKLDPSVDESDDSHAEATEMTTGHAQRQEVNAGTTALPGLAVAESGYRLVPERTVFDADPSAAYRFRIVDDSGETVRDFDVEHARRMHLIVVRRDFQNFQHLHPQQLDDGGWAVDADLSDGGVYRAFADFATDGLSVTLATDLFAAGRFDPQPLEPPATSADAGDGYEVSLDSTPPTGGATAAARFTVTRDGRPLDSVEPYLGADGHLVALREHDQAFLHTHPEGEPGGSGPIVFQVEYPTAGRYRLFLQFKHRGEVRTAAFTQEATGTDSSGEEASDGGH